MTPYVFYEYGQTQSSLQFKYTLFVPSRGFEPLIRKEYAPKAYAYTVPPRGHIGIIVQLLRNCSKRRGHLAVASNIKPQRQILTSRVSLGM